MNPLSNLNSILHGQNFEALIQECQQHPIEEAAAVIFSLCKKTAKNSELTSCVSELAQSVFTNQANSFRNHVDQEVVDRIREFFKNIYHDESPRVDWKLEVANSLEYILNLKDRKEAFAEITVQFSEFAFMTYLEEKLSFFLSDNEFKMLGRKVLNVLENNKDLRTKCLITLVKWYPLYFCRHVDQFNLNQEDRATCAKIVLEKYPGDFCDHIDQFDLSREDLAACAKMVAKKYPPAFFDYIDKFKLKETDFAACMEIVLQNYPADFTNYIGRLKFIDSATSTTSLLEKYPKVFCDYMDQFNLSEEQLLVSAKILAAKSSYFFARNIDKFKLTKSDVKECVEILLEKGSSAFCAYADKFGLTETELKKYAKIAAEKSAYSFCINMDKFNLTEAELKQCAELVSEESLQGLCRHIDKFKLTEVDLKKYANLLMKSCPSYFCENIDKFKLSQAELKRCAKVAVEKESYYFCENIDKFNLEKEDFFECTKILLGRGFYDSCAYIDKFNLEEKDRLACAKIALEKNPNTFCKNIDKFKLKEEAIAICAKIMIEKSPNTFCDHIDQFKLKKESFTACAEIIGKQNLILLCEYAKELQLDDNDLLRKKSEVDVFETTFLMAISACGLDSIFSEAVKDVVDINAVNLRGDNALSLAIKNGHVAIQRQLIARGAKLIEPSFDVIREYADLPKSLSPLKKDLDKGESLYDNILCARYPNIFEIADTIPGLQDFIEELLSDDFKSFIWDFKINQRLPLTKQFLDRIRPHLDNIPFRLALQTCDDPEDAFSLIEPVVINSKDEFFNLPIEEQGKKMRQYQTMRARSALPLANKVIKQAVHEDEQNEPLLFQSLKLYERIGAEGSSKALDRLQYLLRRESLSVSIRAQAAFALSQCDVDAASFERQKVLLEELTKTDQPVLQRALLEALEKYTVSDQNLIKALLNIDVKISDPNTRISYAKTLSVISDADCLIKALEIVDSSIWDSTQPPIVLSDKKIYEGDYTQIMYRPIFHDSRDNMRRIIAERYCEMCRSDKNLADQVEACYQAFDKDPVAFPRLLKVDNLLFEISQVEESVRYVPFQVYLPPETVIFRGVNARKGEVLGNAVLNDILLKGMGPSDLTLYQNYNFGTWGKIGHTFGSVSLDYVTETYFDSDGVLIAIPSEYLNEAQLRRSVRFEYEAAFHGVFYDRIRESNISCLCISNKQEPNLTEAAKPLSARHIIPLQGNKTLGKIIQRRLTQSVQGVAPLKDRILYFDPCQNVDQAIEDLLNTHGLKAASWDAIVEENVKRQIRREILSNDFAVPKPLQECLAFAAAIKTPFFRWK